MTKLTSLFAALLMASTQIFAAEIVLNGITYNINTVDNTATVAAFDQTSGITQVVIPSKVEYNSAEYPVTSIGDSAFLNCSTLSEITIPASVTSIGVGAFEYCESLSEITIPASVTSIGENAFHYCSRLDKTNYTGTIADWCKIKFANIDANPLSWSMMLLYINDVEVKNLVIPQGVETIGNFAFARRGGFFESIAFEGNLCQNNIAESAFEGIFNSWLILPDSWGNMYLPIDSNTPWHGGIFNSNRYYSLDAHKEEAIAAIDAEAAKVTDWSDREIYIIGDCKDHISRACTKAEVERPMSYALDYIAKRIELREELKEVKQAALAEIDAAMGDFSDNEYLHELVATEISAINAATDEQTITNNKTAAINKLSPVMAMIDELSPEIEAKLLGSLATPCDDCPAVIVTDGETTVTLYNPKQVQFKKTEAAED